MKVFVIGQAAWMEGFKGMQPHWLPAAFADPFGQAVPWVEFIAGLMLVLGLFTRLAGGVAFMLMVGIIIALVQKNFVTMEAEPDASYLTRLWAAISKDEAGKPFSNTILATVYFMLLFCGAGRCSIDGLLFRRSCKVETDRPTEPTG